MVMEMEREREGKRNGERDGEDKRNDEAGNAVEGGLVTADAVMLPGYMKDDDQKKLFDGAKKGCDRFGDNRFCVGGECDLAPRSSIRVLKDREVGTSDEVLMTEQMSDII